MPAEQVRALARQAHGLDRPVFAHPSNMTGLNLAIDNGVDILAHAATLAGEWTPELVARMRARDMALIPTLQLFQITAGPRTPVEIALQQVDVYAAAGGEILFGTDVGFLETYDPSTEYHLMGRVLDWRAILASLTTAPARRFGEGRRLGRVQRGYGADLVILSADPASDVTAFARVSGVIRRGEMIYGGRD